MGIVLGMTIGLTAGAWNSWGAGPSKLQFAAGQGGLLLLTGLLPVVPVSAHAAYRDPVRILCVP